MKLNNKQKAIIDEKFKNHLAVRENIIKDWEESDTILSLKYETVLLLKEWDVIDSLEKVRDFALLKDEELIKISLDLIEFSTSLLHKYKLKLLLAVSLNEENGGGRNNGLYSVVLEGTKENLTLWVVEDLEFTGPDLYKEAEEFVEDNIIK